MEGLAVCEMYATITSCLQSAVDVGGSAGGCGAPAVSCNVPAQQIFLGASTHVSFSSSLLWLALVSVVMLRRAQNMKKLIQFTSCYELNAAPAVAVSQSLQFRMCVVTDSLELCACLHTVAPTAR